MYTRKVLSMFQKWLMRQCHSCILKSINPFLLQLVFLHYVMQFEVRDNVQISLPQTPRMKFMAFYSQTLVETWDTENTDYITA